MLKVAILAEKYATDYTWYVDVILKLIRIAGDYVSEEVWYRVIQVCFMILCDFVIAPCQIVVNREDVQGYAAKTCFEALQVGIWNRKGSSKENLNAWESLDWTIRKKWSYFSVPLATRTWSRSADTSSESSAISSLETRDPGSRVSFSSLF